MTAQGNSVYEYRSTDVAGNVEAAKAFNVLIRVSAATTVTAPRAGAGAQLAAVSPPDGRPVLPHLLGSPAFGRAALPAAGISASSCPREAAAASAAP